MGSPDPPSSSSSRRSAGNPRGPLPASDTALMEHMFFGQMHFRTKYPQGYVCMCLTKESITKRSDLCRCKSYNTTLYFSSERPGV